MPRIAHRRNKKVTMNKIPAQADLTSAERTSLFEIARGFSSRTLPAARIARLVQLGLIQEVMGGLMITPAGGIVARGISIAK